MKFKRDAGSEFSGMRLDVNPLRMGKDTGQFDRNGDSGSRGIWAVRSGFARSNLPKFIGIVRNIRFFYDDGGIIIIITDPKYPPIIDGWPPPGGGLPPDHYWDRPKMIFPPATALTGTDIRYGVWDGAGGSPIGHILSWTNPVSPDWRGTRVLRRTDCYPQGPLDPAATVLYDGRLATYTETVTVGTTYYYCAYAYSRAMWALPAKLTKVWGSTGSLIYWKVGP